MDKAEFIEKVKRFIQIGEEVASLSIESRKLRKEIAEGTDELALGRVKVNEVEPVEFLVGNVHVSVKKAKDDKDYSIITRKMEQLDGNV